MLIFEYEWVGGVTILIMVCVHHNCITPYDSVEPTWLNSGLKSGVSNKKVIAFY